MVNFFFHLIICIFLIPTAGEGTPPVPRSKDPMKNNIHHCVHATNKIKKRGDGSTSSSCMRCDPALPSCAVGCQTLIDVLYRVCDNICIPDGYYFDSASLLQGCWSDNENEIKIQVERCGCNSSNQINGHSIVTFALGVSAYIFDDPSLLANDIDTTSV
eukprot:gene4431-8832_t